MRLANKVAIVTGGGKGIGREIGLLFAKEGCAVVLAGSTDAAVHEVAAEVTGAGGRALAQVTDVADEKAVQELVANTIKQFGQVDILINNAGIIGPTAPVVAVDTAEWQRVLDVNLTGAFLCAKHALPGMIERRAGRVINITSVAGLMAYALRSPYSVSKWGMIGLTRTLAEEVGRYDITVNAIAPGPVKGPRIDEVIRRRSQEMGRPVAEVEQEFVGRLALKRMVENSDIAAMALFLASEDGRNITGETITISGGFPL